MVALPKLTAEVFERPDCPVWANYALVNFDNKCIFLEKLPDSNINCSRFLIMKNWEDFLFEEDFLNTPICCPQRESLPDWVFVDSPYYNVLTKEYNTFMNYELVSKRSALVSMIKKGMLIPALTESLRVNELKRFIGKKIFNPRRSGSLKSYTITAVYDNEIECDNGEINFFFDELAENRFYAINGEPLFKYLHYDSNDNIVY